MLELSLRKADVLRVFIGYEPQEAISWHVAASSIFRQASEPVSITPITSQWLTRPRDAKQSNDFAFARFLVPWLCNYEGWALFVDCDVLLRADVSELFRLADPEKAVMVVQHDYVPKDRVKYLGNQQHAYARKNWSSVMLFNNAKCKRLSQAYVDRAPGLELHQFGWCKDDEIGALPLEWNHLVSEYEPNLNAKLAHFTVGGPWFHEYKGCEFSEEWLDELQKVTHAG